MVMKNTRVKNLIPGTLIYRGDKNQKFYVELHIYDEKYYLREEFKDAIQLIEFYKSIEKEERVIWINIVGINNVEYVNEICKYFGISNLHIEQILYISNHSVNEYTSKYIFNDFQMVYSDIKETIISENISIYKKENIVISFQERKGDVFDSIRERLIEGKGIIRNQNADYLYYAIFDAIIDYYLDTLNIMSRKIEMLEEKIVNIEKINVKDIHKLKKQILVLKLSAQPLEKMINVFVEDDKLLKICDKKYLFNLRGHIKEVVNELNLQKEYIDSLFENYVLNNSNEMNSIMTTLTIFSAIFIPLSFFAGVFGMNFNSVPGLMNPNGFIYFIIGCSVSFIGMLIFFKIKKWF